MNRAFTAILCVMMLAGCGVKRPLIAPKDIPQYETDLRKKRERIMQQQDDIDRANADKLRDNAAKSVITPALQGTR